MIKNIEWLIKRKKVNHLEILDIVVEGFRNISSSEISFDKITALVGLNGHGKSNVIDAIDYGFDFIKASPSQKSFFMNYKSNIPLLNSCAGKDYRFQVTARSHQRDADYIIVYEFCFSWGSNKNNAQIVSEQLKVKLDAPNQKFQKFISRNDLKAFYKSSETGRCTTITKITNDTLVINKLLSVDNLFFYDILDDINNTCFYIEKHLDASASYIPDPFIIKGFQELELEGIQSIPRAIFYLKKENPDKYEILMDAFQQLFPYISIVDVHEVKLVEKGVVASVVKKGDDTDSPFVFTDSIYSMSVNDTRLVQPIKFEDLSDGTKRVFLMLTYAVIADIKGLSMIAIEEPENSIHPKLFQHYLDVLAQLTQKCKLVFTSHSPYVIQYIKPENIYVGIDNSVGEVDFKRIAPTKINKLYRDAYEYDFSIGDYIFDALSSEDEINPMKEYTE